jgi:LSD1 subclass zinc finger protein
MVEVVLIHAMVTENRRKVTGFVLRIKRHRIHADTQPTVTDNSLIRIMCPNLSCQRILVVPEGARGKVVRCSMCGMNVRIPAPKKEEPVAPPRKTLSARRKDATAAAEDGATTESA